MPQRTESKGSTDLDALQQQQARSNAQFAARAFSMPTPGGGLPAYSGTGGLFGAGGVVQHATAAATAALQTAGLHPGSVSDTLGGSPWGLPFALQRTAAFGDAAATTAGYDGCVVSPQPRYPGEGAPGGGVPDNSSPLWGCVKAAAAAVASRPQASSANVSACCFL